MGATTHPLLVAGVCLAGRYRDKIQVKPSGSRRLGLSFKRRHANHVRMTWLPFGRGKPIEPQRALQAVDTFSTLHFVDNGLDVPSQRTKNFEVKTVCQVGYAMIGEISLRHVESEYLKSRRRPIQPVMNDGLIGSSKGVKGGWNILAFRPFTNEDETVLSRDYSPTGFIYPALRVSI